MTGTCPPEDELVRMVEGALGDASLAQLESHVDRCERCAAVIAGLGALDSSAARPRIVGRYQLDRRIGGGGMGEVWAAWDPQLRRDVAIKLVKPERTDDGRERERLLREARALARLTHPNVLAVYDVGEVDGEVFIATELVAGDTLASRGGANADWRELARLYAQAARGLAAAHEAGLVHRDIKPANLLLGTDGRVRVADFGLAVRSATPSPMAPTELASHASSDRNSDRITQTGYIAGTPAYMAPEQRLGEPADARADQYALCVALTEGIAGRRPPLDVDRDTLIAFVAERRPREDDLDRLCGVLARGLSIVRDERHPDATSLAEAIEACIAPPSSPLAARRRGWVLAVTAGAALAGIASVLVVWQWRERAAPAPAAVASVPDAAAPDAAALVAVVVPAPDAPSAPAFAPPVSPPAPPKPTIAPDPQQLELGMIAVRRALTRRDGRRCLAELAKLPANVPLATANLIALYRGQCEMLAGDCAGGQARVDRALDAMGSPPNGEALAIALCPITGPFKTRLQRLTSQAFAQRTPADCRAYLAHARTLAGEAATAVDKAQVGSVLRHIAKCVRDCKEAEALWAEAHALDNLPMKLELEHCPQAAAAPPPPDPIADVQKQLAAAQQAIGRRDLAACRKMQAASVPSGIPQPLAQSFQLVQGYCTMLVDCSAGAALLAKAYNHAHPATVTASMDTYCPIEGALDARLRRIHAQLDAFAPIRMDGPTLAWCRYLARPAQTAAREAATGDQRASAAKALHHLAWCHSTAGRCSEAYDLSSLAAEIDPAVAAKRALSAKCP